MWKQQLAQKHKPGKKKEVKIKCYSGILKHFITNNVQKTVVMWQISLHCQNSLNILGLIQYCDRHEDCVCVCVSLVEVFV